MSGRVSAKLGNQDNNVSSDSSQPDLSHLGLVKGDDGIYRELTSASDQNSDSKSNDIANVKPNGSKNNVKKVGFNVGDKATGEITGIVIKPNEYQNGIAEFNYVETDWIVELALLLLSSRGVNISTLDTMRSNYSAELDNVMYNRNIDRAKRFYSNYF